MSNRSPTLGQCANVPIAGTPLVISEREPSTTITRKPRNAIAAGVRMPSDTESTAVARRVADRAQPVVGVEVVGEERAEPRGARHLQLAELGVVHGAQRLRALARRAQAPHVEQVREPAADRGPGPAWVAGEQVADRLDEPHHEPDRHQPQQLVQRVRREEHAHARRAPARTRRAGRRAGGRSAASRCVARASGTTSTRAPASRARQHRSRSSAPGKVSGSKPSSSVNRSVRTSIDRGGDVEDVAHAVVLLLVDLAGLDAGVRRAEAVDRAAHLEQDLGVLGAHELRARGCRRWSGTPPRPGPAPRAGRARRRRGRSSRKVAPSTAWRASLAASAKPGAVVEPAHERPRQHRRRREGWGRRASRSRRPAR